MSEYKTLIEEEREKVHDFLSDTETAVPLNISTVPVVPQLALALGLLVFVFGITYMGATNSLTKKTLPQTDMHVVDEVVPENAIAQSNAYFFNDTDLRAHSAIVWDVKKQRILFNKNADEQLPLASITKLMTALVAYNLMNPDEKVVITSEAITAEGDSGLADGEKFTMQDLSDLMLISSSNDSARAISATAGNALQMNGDSEAAFVQAMNIKAEELGLTKTYFKNSTGLDLSESTAGAYGSARDVALLMEHIMTNSVDAIASTNLDETSINNKDGGYHTAKNTNEVVNNIDGLIASKTGYTTLSGGNLVVAVNVGLNHPVIVTVLGSSQEGRFSDTLDLLERARASIENDAY